MTYNEYNPAPNGPNLYGSEKYNTIQISTSNFSGSWPAVEYENIVDGDTEINYKEKPFTYIKVNTNIPITINLTTIEIGTSFSLEVEGTGNVTITVIGTSSSILIAGTYFLVIFSDSIKSTSFNNPIP